MTIDEIEAMTDDDWRVLTKRERAEAMQVILDTLTAEGMAYKGDDGRYRMREDVVFRDHGNGQATAFKGNPN